MANGFGKAAGFLQVQELGTIETPMVLTTTLAVGSAIQTVVAWSQSNEGVLSVNAVVGETNDGNLNDVRALPIRPEHMRAAVAAARSGPAAEGSVGAGTGTRALGWKGGISTASRGLPEVLGGWRVGALVQSNFDGLLHIGFQWPESPSQPSHQPLLAAIEEKYQAVGDGWRSGEADVRYGCT